MKHGRKNNYQIQKDFEFYVSHIQEVIIPFLKGVAKDYFYCYYFYIWQKNAQSAAKDQ